VFFALVYLLYVVKLSPICIASSRVGVITNDKIFCFSVRFRWSFNKCWIIGSAKAAVLPVPVCAHPKISSLFKIIGMDLAWIEVGSL
tara:strand:- start:790 stop:1050 length:261 start_codon:yes stop_codon:yes gene_type:complete